MFRLKILVEINYLSYKTFDWFVAILSARILISFEVGLKIEKKKMVWVPISLIDKVVCCQIKNLSSNPTTLRIN